MVFSINSDSPDKIRLKIKEELSELNLKGFMANNPRYKIDDVFLTIMGSGKDVPYYVVEDPLNHYFSKIGYNNYILTDVPYGIISGDFQNIAVGRILNVNINNKEIRNALLISEYRHNKYLDIVNYDGGMFTSLILKKQMNKKGIDVKRIGEKRVEFNNETWEELKGNANTIKEIIKMIYQGKEVSWNAIYAYMKAVLDIVRIASYIIMETDTSNWNFMSDDFLHIEELSNESFNDLDYDVLFVSGIGNGSYFFLPNNSIDDVEWALNLFSIYTIPYNMQDLEFNRFFYFDYGYSGREDRNVVINLAKQGAYGVASSDMVHDVSAILRTANFFKFALYYNQTLGSSLKDSGNVEIGSMSKFSIKGLKKKEFYERIYFGNPKYKFILNGSYGNDVYYNRIKDSLKDGVVDYVKDKVGMNLLRKVLLYKYLNYTNNYTLNNTLIFYDYDDVLYNFDEPIIPYKVFYFDIPQNSVLDRIEFKGEYVNYTNVSLMFYNSEIFNGSNGFDVFPNESYWFKEEKLLDNRTRVYLNIPLMKYYNNGVSEVLENATVFVYYSAGFKIINVSLINSSGYFNLEIYSNKDTAKRGYVFSDGNLIDSFYINVSKGLKDYVLRTNVSYGRRVYSFVFDNDSKSVEVLRIPKLKITEIMFNPKGKESDYEYVEVKAYDNVSLGDLAIVDEKEFGCLGNDTLKKDSFLIFGRNFTAIKGKYNRTGLFCYAKISLNNGGDEVKLKWKSYVVDSVEYNGSSKEEGSWQFIKNSWYYTKPTPWEENKIDRDFMNPINIEILNNESVEGKVGRIAKVEIEKERCVKENVNVVFTFESSDKLKVFEKNYDVGCSKTIDLDEALDSGKYNACVNVSYKGFYKEECFNFSVRGFEEIECNVSVDVVLENDVFSDKKSNKYYIYLKDGLCSNVSRNVDVEYWIEDLFGNIVKKKYVSKQDFVCEKLISRSWNPVNVEGTEAYYIYVNISNLKCNQSYAFNKKLVVVKGTKKRNFKSRKVSTRKYIRSKDYSLNVYVEKNIRNNESFDVLISLFNYKRRKLSLDVYSYGYDRNRLLTYGYNNGTWEKKWDANKVHLEIEPFKKKEVWLKNKFVVDRNGSYNFKVRLRGDINKDVVQKVKVVKDLEKNYSVEDVLEKLKYREEYDNISVECYNKSIKIRNNENKRVHLKVLENGKEKGIYVRSKSSRVLRYGKSVNVSVLSYDLNHVYGKCSININNEKFNKITGRYIVKESRFKRWLKKWLWFLF